MRASSFYSFLSYLFLFLPTFFYLSYFLLIILHTRVSGVRDQSKTRSRDRACNSLPMRLSLLSPPSLVFRHFHFSSRTRAPNRIGYEFKVPNGASRSNALRTCIRRARNLFAMIAIISSRRSSIAPARSKSEYGYSRDTGN